MRRLPGGQIAKEYERGYGLLVEHILQYLILRLPYLVTARSFQKFLVKGLFLHQKDLVLSPFSVGLCG